MKRDYLVQAWLVLTLATGFGAALAGVQVALSERIEENKLSEATYQVPRLVPGAASGEQVQPVKGKTVFQAVDESGRHIGWVVKAAGQGFADRIELLIGLDAGARRITGLYVLDQKETPGLGDNIRKAGWLAQFEGKSARSPVTVTKGRPTGNEVRTVSGATISSESVCEIVNRTVSLVGPELLERAEGK